MKYIFAILMTMSATLAHAGSYGDAGCGLGSVIFDANSGQFQQVMAATTNGSSYTQMFGILSGTSNCTDDGAVALNREVPAFIEVNREQLARDAARGEGETVAGLSQLLGCSDSFGSDLKREFQSVFVKTEMQPAQIESEVRRVCRPSST